MEGRSWWSVHGGVVKGGVILEGRLGDGDYCFHSWIQVQGCQNDVMAKPLQIPGACTRSINYVQKSN